MTTLRISAHRPIRSALVEYEGRLMADAARRCAIAERNDAVARRMIDGIAPIEPVDLVALFVSEPESAYLLLMDLSGGQLVNQAIETTSYLESLGKVLNWQDVLERWESRIEALMMSMARAA